MAVERKKSTAPRVVKPKVFYVAYTGDPDCIKGVGMNADELLEVVSANPGCNIFRKVMPSTRRKPAEGAA